MLLKHIYDRKTVTSLIWKNLQSAAAYFLEVGSFVIADVAANTNFSSQKSLKPKILVINSRRIRWTANKSLQ